MKSLQTRQSVSTAASSQVWEKMLLPYVVPIIQNAVHRLINGTFCMHINTLSQRKIK